LDIAFILVFMKKFILIAVLFLAGTAGCRYLFHKPDKQSEPVVIQRDTVTVRDTVYPPIPAPRIIRTVAHDTVRVIDIADSPADSVPHLLPDSTIVIPVSSAVYETEDYRAVVEGYKPRLASMELYPKVTTITNTVTITGRPRWALTGGIGVGYVPGRGIEPYLGISLGYVFWSR
jgi:hypothetical protein